MRFNSWIDDGVEVTHIYYVAATQDQARAFEKVAAEVFRQCDENPGNPIKFHRVKDSVQLYGMRNIIIHILPGAEIRNTTAAWYATLKLKNIEIVSWPSEQWRELHEYYTMYMGEGEDDSKERQ